MTPALLHKLIFLYPQRDTCSSPHASLGLRLFSSVLFYSFDCAFSLCCCLLWFFLLVVSVSPEVRELRDELQVLLEPGSYVGEVIKVMGRNKVLVKVKSTRTRSPHICPDSDSLPGRFRRISTCIHILADPVRRYAYICTSCLDACKRRHARVRAL